MKKKKKNYCKNDSDNDHTSFLLFFIIFSQRILGADSKGLSIDYKFQVKWISDLKLIIKSKRIP